MVMKILLTLFFLSKTQNYAFLLSVYKQKTIKSCQNVLAKDLKEQYIGMNIKQKVIIKIQNMNVDIFLNKNL